MRKNEFTYQETYFYTFRRQIPLRFRQFTAIFVEISSISGGSLSVPMFRCSVSGAERAAQKKKSGAGGTATS